MAVLGDQPFADDILASGGFDVDISLPTPKEMQLETVMAPRDAFLGPASLVPAEQATGRIAAEQLTRYPTGIPAVVPGERLTEAVIAYLRSGKAAGMGIPGATDPSLEHFRVSDRDS